MKQQEINRSTIHRKVEFVRDWESYSTGKKVNKGTKALVVGVIPAGGFAGYHDSKTPVLLIDGPREFPFTVHEDFVELVDG